MQLMMLFYNKSTSINKYQRICKIEKITGNI